MDGISLSNSTENFQKVRDRTKSCGDVPRRLFLPFSSRFQVSSSFKFHVFLLMQTFLNVCYFTFLTPFRFAKKKSSKSIAGRYIIQTNPVQQVLSTFLIIVAILYALLDLRYWLEQNLKEKPHQAFRLASYVIRGFIPLLWGITFWLKRKWFAKLLLVCQGRKSYNNLTLFNVKPQPENLEKKLMKPNLRLKWVINILVALTLGKVAYEVLQWESWEIMFKFNIQLALYNSRQNNWEDAGILAEKESKNNSSLLYFGLGVGTSVFYVVDLLIENMFDLFCFIGGAMVFAVCGHFTDEMERLSRSGENIGGEDHDETFLQSKRVLKQMQRKYVDLIAILDSINEVFGSLIVLYFMRSYPTLVWCVFGLFRKVSLSYGVFYLHKIFIFILVTVTAAEGNSKVQQFKQWLFHTSLASSTGQYENEEEEDCFLDISNNDSIRKEGGVAGQSLSSPASDIDMVSVNILHREVSTEALGLKGYKFFTVTHGLIGTILGVVVTYAIVMLQFEMDADEGQRSSTLSSHPSTNKLPTTSVPYSVLLFNEADTTNLSEVTTNDIIREDIP